MNNYSDFTFDLVPAAWPVCFLSDCPLSEDCLNYLVGLHVPDSLTCGNAVYPTARHNGECSQYKKIKKIRAAWGFKSLFENVKERDASTLRSALKNSLGGNGTYYRYNNGQRLLTPEQQDLVLSIFHQFGYTDNLHFDGYRDIYDFS